MDNKPTKPTVRGNWFWCDPYGSSTNEASCRERMARNRPYSPCRHCQRWQEGASPRVPDGQRQPPARG